MENEEYENWNDLFADLQVPDDVTLFTSDGETLINPPCTDSSWIIGDIESMLMKDDDDNNKNGPIIVTDGISIDEFLSDLLVDSAGEKSSSNDESVKSTESGTEKDIEKVCYTPEVNVDDDNDSAAIDDPVSNKKQRRQLRNRDAAVQSRERKKMYVKDLEVKSKYLEGECRRLGRMIQCVVAENHALRYSLQCSNVHGAPFTKQESAVLMMACTLLCCCGLMHLAQMMRKFHTVSYLQLLCWLQCWEALLLLDCWLGQLPKWKVICRLFSSSLQFLVGPAGGKSAGISFAGCLQLLGFCAFEGCVGVGIFWPSIMKMRS